MFNILNKESLLNMKEFWDQRYAHMDYAYGTKPNAFFKQQLDNLSPGRILLPAEGEGRNAIYAASKGWEVCAFDISDEGKKKADQLAERVGAEIFYQAGEYDKLDFGEDPFDLIALIFAHVDSSIRNPFHVKMVNYLRPGGILILEGFSKEQFTRTTGGPKNPDMLFSRDEMKEDFAGLKRLRIWEREVLLNEGLYHQGLAAIIRARGTR
jgi:SAM-dependent methyltransferase